MTMTTTPVTTGIPSTPKKDIYQDTPVRFLGYSNELGTAVSELCVGSKGIVRSLPKLSYIPAIAYIGADTYDKYKKGIDGTGEKPSLKMGARQLLKQCAASVLIPTGVIIATQKTAMGAINKLKPVLPDKIKEGSKKAKETLKNNKVFSKILSKPNAGTKVAAVAISLAALVLATKPIDKITEVMLEKVVDPILGISKKEDETID